MKPQLITLLYKGEITSMIGKEWAVEIGITYTCLMYRYGKYKKDLITLEELLHAGTLNPSKSFRRNQDNKPEKPKIDMRWLYHE